MLPLIVLAAHKCIVCIQSNSQSNAFFFTLHVLVKSGFSGDSACTKNDNLNATGSVHRFRLWWATRVGGRSCVCVLHTPACLLQQIKVVQPQRLLWQVPLQVLPRSRDFLLSFRLFLLRINMFFLWSLQLKSSTALQLQSSSWPPLPYLFQSSFQLVLSQTH